MNGVRGESIAVCVSGTSSTLVAVVAGGVDPAQFRLHLGIRQIPVRMTAHDPVSRLGFVQTGGEPSPTAMEWADEIGSLSTATLHFSDAKGSSTCRTTGWVKQVGGKILPFALVGVAFSGPVPLPGTPLLNDAGKIVAIVFQSAGAGNDAYAIPAEAVHRVHQDLCDGGNLDRGWLGLALRADARLPQISRVLPNSPAAAARIQPNDVILSIGSRQITDYADAANAFFYLIPGRAVRVKCLRGTEMMEFTLTPTRPQGE